MNTTIRTQRRYDHRLRDLVGNTQNVDGAIQQGVPCSTARGWLSPMITPVVTLGVVDQDAARLQAEVLALCTAAALLTTRFKGAATRMHA